MGTRYSPRVVEQRRVMIVLGDKVERTRVRVNATTDRLQEAGWDVQLGGLPQKKQSSK